MNGCRFVPARTRPSPRHAQRALERGKIFDADYLKHFTNAAYLTAASESSCATGDGKPLVFDQSDGRVKVFDDAGVEDPMLEGETEVQAQKVRPAFELIKTRAAEYSAERVEEITTIPAKTLRRIAREFGEAASIGATVRIDGIEVPYRPVCLDWDRGPQGHKHAWHHTWALAMVNVVLGAVNVVGSIHSTDSASNFPFKKWPEAGDDGILMSSGSTHRGGGHFTAFPGRTPTRPERWDLFELFPVAAHTRTLVPEVHKDPKKWGMDHKIEMVIHSPGNQVMAGWGDASGDRLVQEHRFRRRFRRGLNETHELDDIVLPMCSYLEEDLRRQLGLSFPAVAGKRWASARSNKGR
jgi:hypothetical protein